ncbi:MAG: phosphate ABC transporter permease subunit PstC [Elusimicrobiota bacterium]
MKIKNTENYKIELLFSAVSFFSLLALFLIFLTLAKESFHSIKEIGLIKMITSSEWYPTDEENPAFGMLPLITASLYVTFLSLLISIPIGTLSAVYISEFAKPKAKLFLKSFIEIISAVPSVVFGFWGIVFLVPIIQKLFDLPTGYCILTSSIVLGIMAVPIITSLCEDALNMVPSSLREASYALGAEKHTTIIRIIIPAASSGIFTAIILGAGRIIGETMVVLMLSGGAAVIPESLTDPARPITSAIASEMGETVVGSLHYSSLFTLGLILFVITVILSVLAQYISSKYSLKLGKGR